MNAHTDSAPVTLTDWQDLFWKRRGGKLLNYSTSEICLRLVEASGYIAEAVRRNKYYLIIGELGKGLGRLLDVYNRVAYDENFKDLFKVNHNGFKGLEASIFDKFPKRCFYCGGVHCECHILFGDTDERTTEDEKKAHSLANEALRLARLNETPPKTLDEYDAMFARVYGQGHRYSDLDSINHHLMEEIGEIAKAHRHVMESVKNGIVFDEQKNQEISPDKCRDNFCSEIADALSWIVAIRRKSEYHILKAIKEGDRKPDVPKLSQTVAEFLNQDSI